MANPNIVNVGTISGKTLGAALGTGTADLVTNSGGSGKIFKINSVYVSNIDGTSAAACTLTFYDSSATATWHLVKTVSVPADATLVVISKNEAVYLEEGDKIAGYADVAGDLQVVISYEEIS
jgi:hypothetical protein|tara:strand:+ start:1232 stop:1597 length:366 start_codon:yes stop_codon:yes gene_type:complete